MPNAVVLCVFCRMPRHAEVQRCQCGVTRTTPAPVCIDVNDSVDALRAKFRALEQPDEPYRDPVVPYALTDFDRVLLIHLGLMSAEDAIGSDESLAGGCPPPAAGGLRAAGPSTSDEDAQ